MADATATPLPSLDTGNGVADSGAHALTTPRDGSQHGAKSQRKPRERKKPRGRATSSEEQQPFKESDRAQKKSATATQKPVMAHGGGAKATPADITAVGASAEPHPAQKKKKPTERKPRDRKSKTQAADDGDHDHAAAATATTAVVGNGGGEEGASGAAVVPPPAPLKQGKQPMVKQQDGKATQHDKAASTENKESSAMSPPEGESNKKNKKKKDQDKEKDKEKEQEEEITVDWQTAAWYTGCGTSLSTCYWLLSRCYASSDTVLLKSEPLVRRAVSLQLLHQRLKTELLPRDEVEDEEDDKEDATENAWAPADILKQVMALIVAPVDTEGKTEQPQQHDVATSAVVTVLETEVVEVATELLLSRGGRGDLDVLAQWETHLASLLMGPTSGQQEGGDAPGNDDDANHDDGKDDEDGDQAAEEEEEERDEAKHGERDEDVKDEAPGEGGEGREENEKGGTAAHPAAVASSSRRPRKRQTGGKGYFHNVLRHAKSQIAGAITFHESYAKQQQKLSSSSADAVSWQPQQSHTSQWTTEINRIVASTLVTPEQETLRKNIAIQMQSSFRRHAQWRQCQVLLFGSSLSKFGSTKSDIDLCLRANPNGPQDDAQDREKMSARELRLRMRRTQQQHDGGHVLAKPQQEEQAVVNDPVLLRETLEKATKTVEALVNTISKQRAKTVYGDTAKLRRLYVLAGNWKALVVALHAIVVGGGTSVATTPSTSSVAKAAKDAYHTAMHKQQKQQQREIYAAAALLSRNGCKVDLVVAQARVPVIGFTHLASGLEADLCFENYHACLNTMLLRTYAEFDDRARAVGIAVKHWAKQRALNDASQGFLSSYSFILLVLYYLQVSAKILPNLQNPVLLQATNVPPTVLNGVDVAFCANVGSARMFYENHDHDHDDANGSKTHKSVGDLVAGFFQFYVEQFDFSEWVVSIRNPELFGQMTKAKRWGRSSTSINKLKAWRVSIEDPLEKDRDLGSVVQWKCQQKLLDELTRAWALLQAGESFEAKVCEPQKQQQQPVVGGGKDRHGQKQKPGAHDKNGNRKQQHKQQQAPRGGGGGGNRAGNNRPMKTTDGAAAVGKGKKEERRMRPQDGTGERRDGQSSPAPAAPTAPGPAGPAPVSKNWRARSSDKPNQRVETTTAAAP